MKVTVNPNTGEVSFDVDTVDEAVELARQMKVEVEERSEGACSSSASAELTGAQYAAWEFLVEHENVAAGVTLSSVARHLKITNQAAGQRMIVLVEKGYAERVSVGRYRASCPTVE